MNRSPLAFCVVLGCVETVSPPSVVGDASVRSDGCAAEFLEMEFSLPDGSRHHHCMALPRGIAMTFQTCLIVYSVSVGDFHADPHFHLSAEGNPFRQIGTSAVGFGYASRSGVCGLPVTYCDFRAYGFTCRLRVVRSGGLGSLVEGELAQPCQMIVGSSSPYAATLHRARIRGVLRLGEDIGSWRPDGGPDASRINPRCAELRDGGR